MMNQAATQSADARTMTPAQQVAYYEEQGRLCAAQAAHYAEQAKLHTDYVEQLTAFHGLAFTQTPARPPVAQVEVPYVQEAPPGFHQAQAVNVGSQRPSEDTIRFDQVATASSASGTFAAGTFPPPSTPTSQTTAPVVAAPAFAAPAFAAPAFAAAPAAMAPAFASPPEAHVPATGQATPEGIPKASIKRALAGSAAGVFIGAAIWGGVGFITGGWEFKYGAVLIGLIVGGLALKGAGAPSKAVGITAGAMSLVSLLLGKVLFELLVHPGFSMGEHIAYHTTIIDLIFYGATAATGFFVASSAGALGKVKAQLGRYIPALR
ncbi:MAG: hypothetical protein ACI9KE_003601 [Polyangiales bacterium]|jgi:hypothetical protein